MPTNHPIAENQITAGQLRPGHIITRDGVPRTIATADQTSVSRMTVVELEGGGRFEVGKATRFEIHAQPDRIPVDMFGNPPRPYDPADPAGEPIDQVLEPLTPDEALAAGIIPPPPVQDVPLPPVEPVWMNGDTVLVGEAATQWRDHLAQAQEGYSVTTLADGSLTTIDNRGTDGPIGRQSGGPRVINVDFGGDEYGAKLRPDQIGAEVFGPGEFTFTMERDEYGPIILGPTGNRVGIPTPEVQAQVAAAVERMPSVKDAIAAMLPTAQNIGNPEATRQQIDTVLAAARAPKADGMTPRVEAILAKARQNDLADPVFETNEAVILIDAEIPAPPALPPVFADSLPPVPAPPMREVIAETRAAAEDLTDRSDFFVRSAPLTLTREEYPDRFVPPFPVDPTPQQSAQNIIASVRAAEAAEKFKALAEPIMLHIEPVRLFARFGRPSATLVVSGWAGAIGEDDDVVMATEAPDSITVDDYRTQLDAADVLLEENRPGWRTVTDWQVVSWSNELVVFGRDIEPVD